MHPDLEKTLQEKGMRPTAMRLLVLDYLLNQTAAVSLNNLESYFHRSDRVTLYRTLNTFADKGLVHGIEDGSGSVKYALCPVSCNTYAHHDLHVHFSCNQCHETFCLPKSSIPEIVLPPNFKSEEVKLVVKGICGRCNG